MGPSPIKAIFFDAVGTLFDVKGSVGQVYVTYAKKYGIPDTVEMVTTLNKTFKETMKTMPPRCLRLFFRLNGRRN
jgi:putative hydrolase of the HAD superfamily